MEQREVKYIKVRAWRDDTDDEEEEEDGVEVEEEEEEEDFYSSHKFAIGYNELQARWGPRVPPTSTQVPHHTTYSSQPHLSTLSPQPHFPSQTPNQESRRKSLHLPLDSLRHLPSSSLPSSSPCTSSTSSSSSPDSSSPLLLSIPSSSPFLDSSYSSTFSTLSTPTSTSSSSSSSSTPSSDSDFREEIRLLKEGYGGGERERERQGEREGSGRLVNVLRQVIRETLSHTHLRRRRKHQSQHASPNEQVAVLENELEAYRVLSRAKKEAADLLKHELMAVLYERVMAQEEQDQLRRQLEGEIMSLEYQLHVQTAATHHHLATLASQLDRALEEKQVLLQQLHPCLYLACGSSTPDEGLGSDVLPPEGCLIRRRSY
ncbi:uncharacterized protein LOC127002055 [Eriocheir sinensis]|uniref:uncharacterized protein LOC127002055 n=1 Tax=Eriocheir sinensis TaxID=95602 RepID=UPI0021C83467|nr:uncharacterized protein LOC127002055 [Eriocheir sinensis]